MFFLLTLDKIRGHKRPDNTISKRNRTKGQTMICKTIHRKLKIEQYEPHEISSLPVGQNIKRGKQGIIV
jgi:hypothetical protein